MNDNSVEQELPLQLYRAEQVRQLDRIAIEEHGIPGFTLMRRAARAAFDRLLAKWPVPGKIIVFCGTGNNGGDGYVMASLARQQGVAVEVIQLGKRDSLSGDALQARQLAEMDGVIMHEFSPSLVLERGVIVDAMLGTGLGGEVRGDYVAAIQWLNNSGLPVLAVDIPSGLCSDTGRVMGVAVKAQQTVSFIGLKQGLLTGAGPDYTGELYYDSLSVPAEVFNGVEASSERLSLQSLNSYLPRRSRIAHKGDFGHVLVAGGDYGMAGAAVMAAQAALRVGAGLVSCATRPEHIAAMVARCPEIMVHGVISGQEVEPLLERPSVIVLGPGLGQGPWGEQLLQKVIATKLPLVVDADALNIIAAGRVIKKPFRDNWILTPHPGEAARLLGCSTADIQADRFAAVLALQDRYGGAVILKGAGTLVAAGALPGLSVYGSPGMAAGGMGDVLSGVLGALLAQGLSPATAARLGVCLHGRAGELASEGGERGTSATDLLSYLRVLVNP